MAFIGERMANQSGRYLNLFSDRAFKRIFGTEQNKEFTLSLLNAILGEHGNIEDMEYTNTVLIPINPDDKGVVVDLECKTTDGRRILVELQKRRQAYFRERSLYYATWPIQKQGKIGNWDYNFEAVFVVSLLDFEVDKISDERIIRCKMIQDTETHEPWTEKLVFFNVELSRFQKKLPQCESLEDKWCFVLKNLHKLMDKPRSWQEQIFSRLFSTCDKAILQGQERFEFEESEAEYHTMKNALDYAKLEGRDEGIAIGEARGESKKQIEIAKGMLADGMALEMICKYTGLDIDTLLSLQENQSK